MASREAPARRDSTSAADCPSIDSTRSSQNGRGPRDRRNVRLGPRDRLGAGAFGVGVGLRARLARILGGALLDLGSRRLGGLEDPLHLRAGTGPQRLPRAAFQRVAQLLDLCGERLQMRVHCRRVIPSATDRKVPLLDALPV